MSHPYVLYLCALSFLPALAPAGPVSFDTEVMAVLSRAGCNMGACHGNQNGKNGFKLSLRGEDSAFDLKVLTRDMHARRVNRNDPDASLVLLKATAAVPHEGGKRFDRRSPEYALLRSWIADGAGPDPADSARLVGLKVAPAESTLVEPQDRVRLSVQAVFSDGRKRDVTRLCVFEPSGPAALVDGTGLVRREQFGEAAILVRYLDRQATVPLAFVPARPGFAWKDAPEANFIDRQVHAKLRRLRQLPSAPAPDTVFLRRVYLDTLGVLPAPDEARRFLADTRPDRRARLIDELLRRPEFADFWALKWSDLLRNEEKVLDRKGVQLFHQWLRQAFIDNRPLDQFARELITGVGSTYSVPAANYYRALRDPQVRAEATAQVFLGVRLQCAKCHNHPFDRWKQDDYHGLAAFFARIEYQILENNRRDKFDKHEFDGEQVVWQNRTSEVRHPRTNEPMRPALPGAGTPALDASADRLRVLADWVTRPDNPYFARAQANRVWYHLMGRGLVEPNDDFRASNPASHPALLDELAADLVKHGFDMRRTVRLVLNSEAYQRSALPNDTNADDEANYGRSIVRRLQAEQLLDALVQVCEAPLDMPGYRPGIRAGQVPGVRAFRPRERPADERERFLAAFGKPVRSLGCDCERSDDATLVQALHLVTGNLVNGMITRPDNRLGRLIAAGKDNDAIIDELFLAALSRPPTAKEREIALRLARQANRRAGLEDLLWCLINTKEFLVRQ